jgi:hypothetical protein
MAQLDAEGLDLRADRLRHPQSVQRQQRDQGVLSGRAEPGGDEERADLVAGQADGVGLVVDPGPAGHGLRANGR